MLAVTFLGHAISGRLLLIIGAVGVGIVLIGILLWQRRTHVVRAIGAGIVWLVAVRGQVGEERLRLLGQIALAAWFIWLSYQRVARLLKDGVPLGQDIQIYYRAVQEWLAGGDPWSASVAVNPHAIFHYAGSPATTVLLAPSALFSEGQFTALWLVLSAMSAVAIVRWLKLPIWWLLFPPTVEALYSGNPQLVVLMLLLAGAGRAGVAADTIAVTLKVYAIVPLLAERRPRRIVYALGLTLATVVVAPWLWTEYLTQFGAISARLERESAGGFSAFYHPVLLVPTAIAIILLWRRDRKAAGWLAVPALWPSSEFHYSTFAQPVMTPILAVLLSVYAQQGLVPVAIMLDVFWRFAAEPVRTRLAAWAAAASPETSGS